MLTPIADEIKGTSGNDIINSGETLLGLNTGTPVYAPNLQSTDIINGGAGIDTLKVTTESAIAKVSPTMTGVEIVELASGAAVVFDVSNYSDVTMLKSTKSVASTLTAAATADISVSGATGAISVEGGKNIDIVDATADKTITVGAANKYAVGTITVTDTKQGSANASNNNIVVDGGTDVSVTATVDKAAGGTITIGNAKAATGTVTVTQNVTNDGSATVSGGNIAVTGGTSVTVNANTTNTAVKGGSTNAITAGTITVTGDKTTTVNIKQTHVDVDIKASTTGASNESAKVTFAALKAGEKVYLSEGAGTVNTDLTFTADKDLTAEQVAAAFAQLSNGDTQTAGGIVKNGFFTGALDAGWTSTAVSGATVTLTATAPGEKTDIQVKAVKSNGSTATDNAASFKVEVTPSAAGDSVSAVDVGKAAASLVTVLDNATAANKAIKTVTIDGYATSSAIGVTGDATGKTLDKLETLTLKNSATSASINVANGTATALTLNLDKVSGTVNLDHNGNATADGSQTVTDLTIATSGSASTLAVDARVLKNLVINAEAKLDLTGSTHLGGTNTIQTVDINGTAAVTLPAIASTALKSFNAADNTGGVTASIQANTVGLDAAFTKYVFSQGNDVVTLTNTGVNKAIELGAGDDKITLASGTTTLAATIDGGTGTNTLHMDAANAATVSATADFANKIDNFQKLSLGARTTGLQSTVDMANMDNINYVIAAEGALNAKSTNEITFTGLTKGQKLTLDGLTLTAYGTVSAADVAGAFASLQNGVQGTSPTGATFTGTFSSDWTSGTADSSNKVKFTSDENSAIVPISVEEGAQGAAPAITYDWTAGTSGAPAKAEFTFGKLDIGQSYMLFGVTVTAKTNQAAGAVAAKMEKALDATDPSSTSDTDFLVTGTVNTSSLTNWKLDTFSERTSVNGAALSITDNQNSASATEPQATAVTASLAAQTPTNLTESPVTGAVDSELTINNLTSGGTVELIGASAGVKVVMKAATGDADSLNIVTKVGASNLVFGTVDVASVETINVTASDINVDEDGDGIEYNQAGDRDLATLTLKADAAKVINITGNSNLSLTLDGASNKVTKVDASNLTGALTMTAAGASAGIEIIGGSGADEFRASGEKDVFRGNAGKNIYHMGDLTTAYAGADAETFNFGINSNLSKVSKIENLGSGDVITLKDVYNNNTGTAAVVTKFYAAGAQYNATTTTDVAGKVNAALVQTGESEASWFQHDGNTFIVIDANDNSDVAPGASDTYMQGHDIVIEIVGLVDLANGASFNATNGTLEIV